MLSRGSIVSLVRLVCSTRYDVFVVGVLELLGELEFLTCPLRMLLKISVHDAFVRAREKEIREFDRSLSFAQLYITC